MKNVGLGLLALVVWIGSSAAIALAVAFGLGLVWPQMPEWAVWTAAGLASWLPLLLWSDWQDKKRKREIGR